METGRRFRVSFVLLSLGYLLLGVLRLLQPDAASPVICYVLGGLAVAGGLVRLGFYFVKDDQSRVFRNDLAVGILLLLAGMYIIARPAAVMELLPVLLGFAVIFDSVLKLQYAFELKRTGLGVWWLVLLLAVVTLVMGGLLVLESFSGAFLLRYFAAVLLVDGAANLAVLLVLVLRLKKRRRHTEQ